MHFVPIPVGEQAFDDQVTVAFRVKTVEVVFLKEWQGGFGKGLHETII
jgi:hypothetical protein